MRSRRILAQGPDHEPLWVRLSVHQIEDRWAALLVADEEPPPGPGIVKGLAFFGAIREEAEQAAKAYLGLSEPVN